MKIYSISVIQHKKFVLISNHIMLFDPCIDMTCPKIIIVDDCEAAERGEVAAARPGENRRQQNMKNVVHDTEKDYDDDDEEEEDRVENKKSAVARGQEISNATLGLDDSDDDSDA